MRYATILWDLDGTLLNTLSDLTASANAALTSHGFSACTEAQVRAAVGHGVRNLICRLLPEGEQTPGFAEIYADFRAHYTAHDNVQTQPYPGIPALLRELHRQGVAMAVVSNKPDPAVKALTQAHFGDLLPVALGEQAGMRRKPFPDACEAALRLLRRDQAGAVYIGDSETDVATAKNAGLPLLCVSWGFRSVEALRLAGAQHIVPDAEALRAELFGEAVATSPCKEEPL